MNTAESGRSQAGNLPKPADDYVLDRRNQAAGIVSGVLSSFTVPASLM